MEGIRLPLTSFGRHDKCVKQGQRGRALALPEQIRPGVYQDLVTRNDAVSKQDEGASTLGTFSQELLESLTWVMAKHYAPSILDPVDDWLEQLNTFSIYQILPELIDLWGMNL